MSGDLSKLVVHADLAVLEARLLQEADVRSVIALQPLLDGRALYLIETPFTTFPKFAIGSTNAAHDDIHILSTCSARWAAEERFLETLQPGGADA